MNNIGTKIFFIVFLALLGYGGYNYIESSQNNLLDYDISDYKTEVDDSYNLNVSTVYKIGETVTVQNNYFRYENLKLTSNEGSIYISGLKVLNVSDTTVNTNINLLFYNIEKVVIGSYQYRSLDDEVKDSGFIEPGSYAYSIYSIFSSSLYEGYEVSDIYYFSVENLE